MLNNVLREYDHMKKKIKRLRQLIKDFSLIIKQFYRIVSSIEKKLRLKFRNLQRTIKENQCFHQNMQCVAVKNPNLLKR